MDVLSRPLEPKSRAMTALHAAVQGRAAFDLWQGAQSTDAGTEHLDRLEEHWAQLTRLVLEGQE